MKSSCTVGVHQHFQLNFVKYAQDPNHVSVHSLSMQTIREPILAHDLEMRAKIDSFHLLSYCNWSRTSNANELAKMHAKCNYLQFVRCGSAQIQCFDIHIITPVH